MRNKKVLLIGSIVVIILSIVAIIYILVNNNNNEDKEYKIDGIELVEKKEVLNDYELDNLKITNISILTREGISVYNAKLTNTTDSSIHIKNIYVIFHLEDREIKSLALRNENISANDSITINITSDFNLTKVNKIEYIVE